MFTLVAHGALSTRGARVVVTLAAATICLLTAVHFGFIITQFFAGRPARTYSFEGKDHPERWDIPELPLVRMQLEESQHYPTDGPAATAEWDSIFPEHNGGFIVLGPNKRTFGISMFHQMHCLNNIRAAVVHSREGIKPTKHIAHCFNYIRQMVLCRSDTRLEPIEPERGPKAVNAAMLHTCRDWSKVYELLG